MADALHLEDLSVRRGSRQVVQPLNIAARTGEVLAILGPNGAGKTTILKAIAGLLPYSGRVLIGGEPREGLSARALAQRLTFVPQQSLLRAALPTHEVVAQGRYAHKGAPLGRSRQDRDAIEHAMGTADVSHLANRTFTQLSFGEQRRVLLARGLATGATILCLDEPTASLDIAHALAFYALAKRLAADGRCVVMVLHQLDDALRHTDRALLIAEGRCVSQGLTSEVISAQNVSDVYGVRMTRGGGLQFALEGH